MNMIKCLLLFIFLHSFSQNDNKYSIKNILQNNEYDLNSFYVGATLNHSQLNTPVEDLFLSEFTYSTP